jgi:hypothetical protein
MTAAEFENSCDLSEKPILPILLPQVKNGK